LFARWLSRRGRARGGSGERVSRSLEPRDARQPSGHGHLGGRSGRNGMKDLLRVENLTVDFGVHEGTLRAVDHVTFSIPPGGTLALVGEPGSGKSVCTQAIMGLLPRTATISSGSILFHDPRSNGGGATDIVKLDRT